MATAIVEYSKTDAALADLSHRLKGVVFEVATREGMGAALKARAEVRGYRTDLEKVRVEIKSPALERCRLIDAEATRIKRELEALEDPIDQQIKMEESRKERERAEREAKEAARVAGIHEAIAAVNAVPPAMVGKGSGPVADALAKMRDHTIDAQEFRGVADAAIYSAIAALEQLHAGALAQEKAAADEAARVKAEREELARLRAESEQRAREEQARIAEETRKRAEAEAAARAKIEAEERASREKIEAEQRAARLAREEEDRKAKAARDAEEAKARKAREEAAARQAEEDARLREEREKIEAERREIERKAAELLDGRAMLSTFVSKFGKRKEFAPVVKAITEFLREEKAAA
jgi:hypothetical protein